MIRVFKTGPLLCLNQYCIVVFIALFITLFVQGSFVVYGSCYYYRIGIILRLRSEKMII